jgi:hypothetical protein
MAQSPQSDPQDVNLEDTVRIDRRKTILAQIEAALLADKLSVEPTGSQGTGTDPYDSASNRGLAPPGAWQNKRNR